MVFGFHELGGALEVPGRVVGANIYYEWLIYIFMAIPIGFLLYGIIKHLKVAGLGKGKVNKRYDRPWERFKLLMANIFLQKQVIRKPLVGVMHSLLFWGFVYLAVVTGWVAVNDKIGFPPFDGNWYIILSMLADILGLFAVVGIAFFGVNRYILKPNRLSDTRLADGLVILLIFMILVTGFVVEGARLAVQMVNELTISGSLDALSYEKFASPVGYPVGLLLSGLSLSALEGLHRFLWWFHMGLAFSFMALIPFTKLWHIVAAFMQYPTRNLAPSALRFVENIEEAESFGTENIEDFSWRDILDMEACIRCGRCQEVCPAYNTGKALNPKITLIQSLKHHLEDKTPYLIEKKTAEIEQTRFTGDEVDGTEAVEKLLEKKQPEVNPMETALVYDVVPPEVSWACTNCRACMEVCPMFIEHIDKITELRRNLVMWQGDMPIEAQNTFTNMERNSNPWGVGSSKRADWLEERKVRDLVQLLPEDGGDAKFDYLFFGGCATAFDDRYKRVAETFLRLMDKAGVKIAYLGTEEGCCGDSARRLGNEYLFQTLAQANIDTFNSYGVTRIVTTCPHGFNTLKNEYPQLGGNFKVIHYTQLLDKLVKDGKLKVDAPHAQRITYHDSCFLGRHNGIYEQPRRVLAATGAQIIEIERSKANAFCCGAGGGRMWLEEETVEGFKRINATRTDQLLEPNPECIATNCPFCMTMIDDGVKGAGVDDKVKVMDVGEFLWRSIQHEEKK